MFRSPRWLLSHAFVTILIATFIAAGLWQLDRLDQRRDENARVEARLEEPVPIAAVETDGADVEYTPVIVAGTYDPDRGRDILVGNRVADGAPGFWLWSVLDLDDGTEILVNRGFVSRRVVLADGNDLDPVPGKVAIRGILRRGIDSGSIANSGTEVSRPNAALVAADRGVVSRFGPEIYLEIQAQEPPEVDAITSVPPPQLDEGPHFAYAIQWFTFATLGVVGYALVLRRIKRGDASRGDVPA